MPRAWLWNLWIHTMPIDHEPAPCPGMYNSQIPGCSNSERKYFCFTIQCYLTSRWGCCCALFYATTKTYIVVDGIDPVPQLDALASSREWCCNIRSNESECWSADCGGCFHREAGTCAMGFLRTWSVTSDAGRAERGINSWRPVFWHHKNPNMLWMEWNNIINGCGVEKGPRP